MKSTLFLRFVVLHALLFTFFRWVFYLFFKPEELLQADVLQKAFILGARFDLRLTCILLIPLIFFSWWRWNFKSAKNMRRWSLFYVFLSVVWMTFYVFDFGFYDYLDGRMNSSALLFLENPDISFGMLWQSYPVVWILIGFFAFIAFYAHLLTRFVFRMQKKNFLGLPSFINLIIFVLTFLIGLYGQVSQYPLRWSEAFFSPHHFISHLTLNPVLYFFESYEFSNNKQFDEKIVRELYPVFADYLGVKDKNQETLQWTREVKGQVVQNPPNVVVIVMESLSYSKTNLGENPLNPTPEIEKVAAESLVFSNYFSSSEGTARNMFSIMTAIPDVTKIQTSTRNPLVVDQRLIANAYKNYRKMYFVGGSASWANIRGIFSHNIEGIEIYEEGSFDKSKTDVWGVSDLDLFIEAHEKFVKLPKQQPFFAVIQSASFHRPYTIPANPLDFKTVDVPTTRLKEAGFYSLEQFNSLRFSDYSLGHFLKLAKKSSYYQNTLFVITGDHGLPDDGGVNVPKGIHFWELEKYHVPLILHNVKLFPKASVESKMAGHPDVMTSVAAVAGSDHFNTTLGRNLFDSEFDKERYSFIYNYYSELNEYGLLSEQFYLRRNDKNGHQLFAYRSDSPDIDVKDQNQETFTRMKTIADGYYQTAKYMLFHNQKQTQKKGADRNQPQK